MRKKISKMKNETMRESCSHILYTRIQRIVVSIDIGKIKLEIGNMNSVYF